MYKYFNIGQFAFVNYFAPNVPMLHFPKLLNNLHKYIYLISGIIILVSHFAPTQPMLLKPMLI